MSQIAQVVGRQHQQGQFPSQTMPNSKDCKVIQLRSGASYESPPIPTEERVEPVKEKVVEEDVEEEPEKNLQVQPETFTSSKPLEFKVPFPQRLQKRKVDEQFSRFLDIFMKVQINIPLVEALQQMPGYAKFLKDLISKKRR